MARRERLLERILAGQSDAAVRFDELRRLLLALGFEERIRGSHHLFVKSGIVERINLQRDGSHVKPYQLRQVRAIIVKYKLGLAL